MVFRSPLGRLRIVSRIEAEVLQETLLDDLDPVACEFMTRPTSEVLDRMIVNGRSPIPTITTVVISQLSGRFSWSWRSPFY